MSRRKLLSIITILLINCCLHANVIKDVTTMGDIYIVTIDKSGSMTGEGRTPKSMSIDVKNRLLDTDVLDSINFTQDRFLFLVSGLSYNKRKGFGNELKAAPPFDKSLIHPTDNKLYQFSDKKELASHIEQIMTCNDYTHMMSFVSQLRTFSIIHAVNFLKTCNEYNNFDNLFVMTITDDADQNDQWRIDYRVLKKAGSNKIEEVNDSTTKYLFNILNGRGEGLLEKIYSDEERIPHIWLYEYKTRAQIEPVFHNPTLFIQATDGKTLSVRKRQNEYKGDKICFYHIDSMVINNSKIVLNASFDTTFSTPFNYDNKLIQNSVTVWGRFQVEYHDPIYGLHYKTVPFQQQGKIVSKSFLTIRNICLILLGFFILIWLFYLFVVRPRKILFTIYSGLGIKTVIKHGFKFNWKGETIPVQLYYSRNGSVVGNINSKHKNIHIEKFDIVDGSKNEILICSHHPLYLSQDVTHITTEENIKEVYSVRIYPTILKCIYENSCICKVWDNYSNRRNRFARRMFRILIRFINIFNKEYYYTIQNITQNDRLSIVHSKFPKGKRFLVEHTVDKNIEQHNINDSLISWTLSGYYSLDNKEIYDIIISTIKISTIRYGEQIFWNILEVSDKSAGGGSLRDVKMLIHYIQDGTDQRSENIRLIRKYLKRVYKHARIGVCMKDYSFTIKSSPDIFRVLAPSSPVFISYVEDIKTPRIQLLYSPIKERETKEKLVIIKRKYDGWLYLSIIPMKYLSTEHPLAKCLSDKILRVNLYNKDTGRFLILSKEEFTFGDINEKF